MIKGVSKQVVICNDCKNTIFEQIIFIVKPEAVAAGLDSRDMQSEAHRIVEESIQKMKGSNLATLAKPASKTALRHYAERQQYASAIGAWVVWAVIFAIAGIAALITSLFV